MAGTERSAPVIPLTMRVRKLLNQLLAPTGYTISKRRDTPRFTERRVFESMVRRSPGPATIIDVGANVGQTATALARSFPEARIYSLEPFQVAFTQLCANTRAFRNIQAFKLAAGARCGSSEVFLHAERASQVNSLVDTRQATLKAQAAAVETIEQTTLDRFCEDHGIASIDLLKIDTEGYELEVLRGAAGLLAGRKISAVLCEVGLHGDPWHTDFFAVVAELEPRGLVATGFYESDYQKDGRFSHTNALFVHRELESRS